MPALLEITVRPFTPESRTAPIRLSGMPHSPKPPAMMVMPSRSSPARASCALDRTLFIGRSSSSLNPIGSGAGAPGCAAPQGRGLSSGRSEVEGLACLWGGGGPAAVTSDGLGRQAHELGVAFRQPVLRDPD